MTPYQVLLCVTFSSVLCVCASRVCLSVCTQTGKSPCTVGCKHVRTHTFVCRWNDRQINRHTVAWVHTYTHTHTHTHTHTYIHTYIRACVRTCIHFSFPFCWLRGLCQLHKINVSTISNIIVYARIAILPSGPLYNKTIYIKTLFTNCTCFKRVHGCIKQFKYIFKAWNSTFIENYLIK